MKEKQSPSIIVSLLFCFLQTAHVFAQVPPEPPFNNPRIRDLQSQIDRVREAQFLRSIDIPNGIKACLLEAFEKSRIEDAHFSREELNKILPSLRLLIQKDPNQNSGHLYSMYFISKNSNGIHDLETYAASEHDGRCEMIMSSEEAKAALDMYGPIASEELTPAAIEASIRTSMAGQHESFIRRAVQNRLREIELETERRLANEERQVLLANRAETKKIKQVLKYGRPYLWLRSEAQGLNGACSKAYEGPLSLVVVAKKL